MDSELIDKIHFQHKDEYDGFRLIGSVSLYVPVYRLDSRVTFVEKAPIPLFDDFICRLIQAGVTQAKTMSELLGVDLDIVESVLQAMSCSDYIYYNDGTWHLSAPGSRLFKEKRKLNEAVADMEFYFDGLRPEFRIELTSEKARHRLVSLHNEVNDGAAEQALVISARTFPRDIESERERRELSRIASAILEKQGLSVVEIRGFQVVGTSLLYHEYLLIVYSNDDPVPKHKLLAYDPCGDPAGPDYRVTQCLLDLHDRGELDERLWQGQGLQVGMRSLVMNALAAYERGGVTRTMGEIEAEEEETRRRLESSADLAPGQVEALLGKLEALEQEKRELVAYVQRLIHLNQKKNARFVMNYEIRERFCQALSEAQAELDIVSPWITERVVDSDFIEKYRALLERGVRVTILYGIEAEDPKLRSEDPGTKKKEHETERLASMLRRMGQDYPVPPRIARANTHEKVLICDDRFLILGSFNFLSYRGEPGPGFRNENGLLIEDPDLIKTIRESIHSR